MTPLISADTWLGAAGWASGSQTCSGTSPALEPAPSSASASTSAAVSGVLVAADRREGVAAVGADQQTEGEQQRERAEARHDQVDVAGAGVVADLVVRHDQGPGRPAT